MPDSLQDNVDYDDPSVEEEWCLKCRCRVYEYFEKQEVKHGEVGEWPAWHVAPYVSIWAVESLKSPGSVGWWAICGDLPTDYLSAEHIKHPRRAMRAFAEEWSDLLQSIRNGRPHAN